jgi:hypothetical protein
MPKKHPRKRLMLYELQAAGGSTTFTVISRLIADCPLSIVRFPSAIDQWKMVIG